MLIIDQTDKTPSISFDLQSGVISIEGRSIIENPVEFYEPLFEKIKAYSQQPSLQTILNMKFDYFNTSTSKVLLDVFHQLEEINRSSEVKIRWYYEEGDSDMQEVGEDYQSIVQLPFEMIEV